MKKEGFTLIELLAVIALLAIMAIVVIPNIVTLYRNAKKNSFVTELREICSKAHQEWLSEGFEEPKGEVFARCTDCTIRELSLTGRTNLDYFVRINKFGDITYFCATDGTHQYSHDGVLKEEDIIDAEVIKDLSQEDILVVSDTGC